MKIFERIPKGHAVVCVESVDKEDLVLSTDVVSVWLTDVDITEMSVWVTGLSVTVLHEPSAPLPKQKFNCQKIKSGWMLH